MMAFDLHLFVNRRLISTHLQLALLKMNSAYRNVLKLGYEMQYGYQYKFITWDAWKWYVLSLSTE